MPSTRFVALSVSVAVGACIMSQPLRAQSRQVQRTACRVSPTASWYTQQRSFSDSAGATWSDNALRQQLLAAAGYDPAQDFRPELGVRFVGAARTKAGTTDSTHVAAARATLREMAGKRQWPSRESVGAAGVQAAWILSQGDSALAAVAIHRMMEAGIGESSPAAVAVMEDANRVRVGRGQLYGTHFVRNARGAPTLYRLEDSLHVDLRRDGAWLPPLKVSACLAAEATRE